MSNSHITLMVTSLLVFMVVEPIILTWQLHCPPESVTLRGEKVYVENI